MSLGQGGQFALQTEQAAQFAAIGHAPIVLAETLFTVHGCDEIQRFLPGEGEFRETGITTLDQACQIIGDLIVAQIESRFRPGCTDIKRCILPGTFAWNLVSMRRHGRCVGRYADNGERP